MDYESLAKKMHAGLNMTFSWEHASQYWRDKVSAMARMAYDQGFNDGKASSNTKASATIPMEEWSE